MPRHKGSLPDLLTRAGQQSNCSEVGAGRSWLMIQDMFANVHSNLFSFFFLEEKNGRRKAPGFKIFNAKFVNPPFLFSLTHFKLFPEICINYDSGIHVS